MAVFTSTSCDYVTILQQAKESLSDFSDGIANDLLAEEEIKETVIDEQLGNLKNALYYVNDVLAIAHSVFREVVGIQESIAKRNSIFAPEGDSEGPVFDSIHAHIAESTTKLMPLVFPLSQKAGEIVALVHGSWQKSIIDRGFAVPPHKSPDHRLEDIADLTSLTIPRRSRRYTECDIAEHDTCVPVTRTRGTRLRESRLRRSSCPESKDFTLIDKWIGTTKYEMDIMNDVPVDVFKDDENHIRCIFRSQNHQKNIGDDFACEYRNMISTNDLPDNALFLSKIIRIKSNFTSIMQDEAGSFDIFLPLYGLQQDEGRVNIWTQITNCVGSRSTKISEATSIGQHFGLYALRYTMLPFRSVVICAYSLPSTVSLPGHNRFTETDDAENKRLSFTKVESARPLYITTSTNIRQKEQEFNSINDEHWSPKNGPDDVIWMVVEDVLSSAQEAQREWRNIFKNLGLKSNEIGCIYHDNCHRGMSTVIRHCVQFLRDKYGTDEFDCCDRILSTLRKFQLFKTADRLSMLIERNQETNDYISEQGSFQ